MNWTAGEVRDLLTIYTMGGMNLPENQYSEARVRKFFELCLIEIPHAGGNEAVVTGKGEAFIEMLLATPLPEQLWVDPRTNTVAPNQFGDPSNA